MPAALAGSGTRDIVKTSAMSLGSLSYPCQERFQALLLDEGSICSLLYDVQCIWRACLAQSGVMMEMPLSLEQWDNRWTVGVLEYN